MNIGEKLFAPREGERPDAYKAREAETMQIFRDALGTVEGQRLLNLLSSVSPPFAPRFSGKMDSHQAAFLDGEKHLLGLLIVHSGNK